MDFYQTSFIFFGLLWSQIGGLCRFPASMEGAWFQSGLGDVTIHDHTMNRKGICREKHNEFYLIENRESSCYQCLLIMQRHKNIIQYKESYCLTENSLDLCQRIRVEAILYTLVRESSIPVPCPFQDAFHFKYNNNTGGWCTQPSSYAHSCASEAKFHFQFKHCPEAAYTYHQDLDFECLASWKDGSEMYMYGGFTGPGLTNKEDTYRCFMFNVFGTVVQLAMSADSTCRGLRTPTDGPLVMEFTKDVFGWPQPACTFPDWFTDNTWQDLSAQHLYLPGALGQTVSIAYRHPEQSQHHVTSALRCIAHDTQQGNVDRFIAVSFSSHGCENRFQCIKFVRKRDNMVEITKGSFMYSEDEKCQDIHFQHAKPTVAIPRHMPGQPCPILGRYFLVPDESGCQIDIRSGCNRTSHMKIMSTCATRPLGELQCLGDWQDREKTFMLARKSGESSGLTNCFALKYVDDTIEFRTHSKCNRGAPHLFDSSIAYTIKSSPAMCADIQTVPVLVLPSQNSLSQSDPIKPGEYEGGAYKHDNAVHNDDPNTNYRNHAPTYHIHHYTSTVSLVCLFTVYLLVR